MKVPKMTCEEFRRLNADPAAFRAQTPKQRLQCKAHFAACLSCRFDADVTDFDWTTGATKDEIQAVGVDYLMINAVGEIEVEEAEEE